MKKHLFILLIALLAWNVLSGQFNEIINPVAKHEYSIYAGGGLSTLRYESAIGSSSGMAGGLMGADYRFFPLKNFGLGVGMEISFYNARGLIGDYSYSEPAKDYEGADFEFRTILRDYVERESVVMCNIPVMLRYRGNPEKNTFYFAVGGKLSIPVSGKYRVVGGASSNSGYYAEENYEYTEQKFVGFGSFPEFGNQEIRLKTTLMIAAEAGMNWRLRYILLYTGVYVDYGFKKNMVEKSNELISAYNSDYQADRSTGSMLASQYRLANGNRESIVKHNVLPVAIGLKIGVTFGHGRKKEKYGNYDHPPVFLGK
ncbi:MAG: outer membrane beta-barrel protein [Prevotellaceae bacterium]|jgi:hypothetical protein|nr:outer membrane beta-barrel protein [Prevotellaceae bacterium]